MSSLTLALFIFGLSYVLIVTERLHKTIVALFGAAVMIGLGVVSQEEAFYSHEFGVDYNVVFLLIGMMVIINIVREAGLFEVLAIWAAQRADAKPFRLLVLLALLTAVLSAMIDNVTTVLLMAPVTLAITKRLELDFFGRTMTVAPHLRETVLALNSRETVPEVSLRRCWILLAVVNVGFCVLLSSIWNRPRLRCWAQVCSW